MVTYTGNTDDINTQIHNDVNKQKLKIVDITVSNEGGNFPPLTPTPTTSKGGNLPPLNPDRKRNCGIVLIKTTISYNK